MLLTSHIFCTGCQHYTAWMSYSGSPVTSDHHQTHNSSSKKQTVQSTTVTAKSRQSKIYMSRYKPPSFSYMFPYNTRVKKLACLRYLVLSRYKPPSFSYMFPYNTRVKKLACLRYLVSPTPSTCQTLCFGFLLMSPVQVPVSI